MARGSQHSPVKHTKIKISTQSTHVRAPTDSRFWWCSRSPPCPWSGRAVQAVSPLPWTRRRTVCRRSPGPSPQRRRTPPPWIEVKSEPITTWLDFTLRSDSQRLRGPAATAPWTTCRPLPCPPCWTSSWSEGITQWSGLILINIFNLFTVFGFSLHER